MAEAAILGYGVVGSGVYEVLTKNANAIKTKAGQPVKIKKILDLRDFPGDPAENIITHDYNEILNDDSIEVIAEVMGGLNPAYDFTKKALSKGKSVVTSNKELVAKYGAELIATAKENNTNYLFEASVGGGIPIIRPLNSSLTADELIEISGILNGTTNYILTKMAKDGEDFNVALKSAQEMGYAEKNPENDVEGYDACRKIAILLSLASGHHIDFNDIYAEGITRVTAMDMAVANSYGGVIKLIASGKIENGGISAKVFPCVIPFGHPLSMVDDVYNAVFVKGNAVGDIMFYGKGAGKMPTASAVAGDIIDAVKHKGKHITQIWDTEKKEITPFSESSVKKLIILACGDKLEAVSSIKDVFGEDRNIAFHTDYSNAVSFETEEMNESEMSAKINKLASSNGIVAVLNDIRVY